MVANVAKTVEAIMKAGLGDRGRLEFIIKRIQNSGKLYNTDKIYVETLANDVIHDMDNFVGDVGDSTKTVHGLPQNLEYDGGIDDVPQPLGDETVHVSGDQSHTHEEYVDTSIAPQAIDHAATNQDVQPDTSNPPESLKPAEFSNVTPDYIKSVLDTIQLRIDEDTHDLAEISKYKDQLADRLKIHNNVLLSIREELRGFKNLVKEQNASVNEQARVLDSVLEERTLLEEGSQRMVGISTELATERKKLAVARKENRTLKTKSISLTKIKKGLEKVNRDIKDEHEKVAQKIKMNTAELEKQERLKQSLRQEIAKLEGIKNNISENRNHIKLAEKVLEESKIRRQYQS